MLKKLCFAAGFLAVAPMAAAETPVLDVLTYDSFVSEWGPGPAIEKAFEAQCACDLRFTPAGDGAARAIVTKRDYGETVIRLA